MGTPQLKRPTASFRRKPHRRGGLANDPLYLRSNIFFAELISI